GPNLAFIPNSDTQHLVSGYAQDEWHIVPDSFYITAGSKFEYNTFSGFEIQPTGRFTWLPGMGQTVWGAISRAVRGQAYYRKQTGRAIVRRLARDPVANHGLVAVRWRRFAVSRRHP